jgi:hypothetical protein
MEAYRRLIDVLIENNDREMAEKETLIFNEYIDKFSHFYKDEIQEEEPVMDSNPDMTDSNSVDNTKTVENEKVLETVRSMDDN